MDRRGSGFKKIIGDYRIQPQYNDCNLLQLKESRTKDILKGLVENGKIETAGAKKDRRYRKNPASPDFSRFAGLSFLLPFDRCRVVKATGNSTYWLTPTRSLPVACL